LKKNNAKRKKIRKVPLDFVLQISQWINY
jgi:hypothetical protein